MKSRGVKGQRVWYHVTERRFVPDILMHGFLPSGGSAGSGTYLWDDPHLAGDWLENHPYRDPVILLVRTDVRPMDIRKMYLAEGAPEELASQYWGHHVVPHRGRWRPEKVSMRRERGA